MTIAKLNYDEACGNFRTQMREMIEELGYDSPVLQASTTMPSAANKGVGVLVFTDDSGLAYEGLVTQDCKTGEFTLEIKE